MTGQVDTGRRGAPSRRTGAALAAATLLVGLLVAPVSGAAADPTPAPAVDPNPAAAVEQVDVTTLGTVSKTDPMSLALVAAAGAGVQVRHVLDAAGPDPIPVPGLVVGPGPLLPLPGSRPVGTGGTRPGGDGGTGAGAGTGDGAGAGARGGGSPVRPRAPIWGSYPGWHSGAAGDAVPDGTFGKWRGSPVTVIATWADTTAEAQTAVDALDTYSGFDGDVDVAIGALAENSGESWAQAARGAYDARWTTAVRNIKAKRSGKKGQVYVRFAHEMTGDWFTWKVTSGNAADFRTAWKRFYGILRAEYPQAKLVFSPNSGNSGDVLQSEVWPGDDYVDVVGPDFYDGWPAVNSAADWASMVNETDRTGPKGPGAWLAYAKAHGKPLAFPEWGLRDGDRPAFIESMHKFLTQCAAKPGERNLAGKCIYDVYFNIANSGNNGFMIYGGGGNANAADLYRKLTWGAS